MTKKKSSSKSVTLSVAGIAAGKLSVTGSMVKRATRTVKTATSASITANLTTKARTALKHHKQVKLALRVSYQPKTGKTVTVTKSVAVSR